MVAMLMPAVAAAVVGAVEAAPAARHHLHTNGSGGAVHPNPLTPEDTNLKEIVSLRVGARDSENSLKICQNSVEDSVNKLL